MEKLKQGVVLITGTTSGVGLNTLKPLITSGWKVVAINRSNKRALDAASIFLSRDDLNKISFIEIDLSDLNKYVEDSKIINNLNNDEFRKKNIVSKKEKDLLATTYLLLKICLF